MSKSPRGIRTAGFASLAVTLSIGVAAPAFADADFAFDRIGGEDRYQTAALVADEYRTVNPDAILANGQPGFYADALSGNYLAGEIDAPILLTRLKQIPDYTLEQLDEMGAQNVWVVGGEGVVPPAQVQQLESEGYNVERIAGDDRFLTNAEVIEAGGAAKDGLGIIATGFDFPDALGGGPLTYQGHPVGLSSEDDIKQAVIDALKGAGVDEVLILGGEAVVGSEVATKLEANGIEVRERLAGANRSGTAAEVAEYAVAELGFSDEGVNVASGYTEGYGADALAGGPLTGQQDRPMLITRNVDNPGAETLAYLEEHCETLTDGIIFGQTGAVSAAAEAEMNEAAQCEVAGGVSTLPELVSASIVRTVPTNQSNSTNLAGTYVQYNFDERVLSANAGDFKVYRSTGDLADTGDSATISSDGMSVVVRFAELTNNTPNVVNADDVADLTLATVVPGAVTDQQGENNPEGDAAIGTAAAPGGGTPTTAGITNAPDLTTVGGFRESFDGNNTIVDFTFDEAAFLTAADVEGGFQLVPTNGGEPVVGTAVDTDTTEPGGGTVPGGNGTTTISVAFPDNLTANSFARGVVVAGTVSDANTGGNENVTQTADVSNAGITTDPDLNTVEFRPTAMQGATAVDQVVYTFDQNVVVTDFQGFQVYQTDGDEIAPGGTTQPTPAVNPANNRQVAVNFPDGSLTNASGANVLPDTVTGTAVGSGTNEIDEVGQSSTSGSTAGRTPGSTDAPDLTDVSIARASSDIFGNEGSYQATYTFDEDVVVDSDSQFFLYLANGDRLTATACENGSTEAADNTVICSAYTDGVDASTSAEIGSAVLGTVGAGAVNDQADAANSAGDTPGGESNPEGAEATTGGTGTPAA